jgi:predicted  nucleic acid-binding Zn-ribbon protein
VPETCPHVDAALSAAADAIKEQTGALRDALVEAIERAMEAEGQVSDLERQIADLQRDLDEANSALREAREMAAA